MDFKDIAFKVIISLFAIFYYLYALVVSKQVKIMDKTLQDEHNGLIVFVTSLQVTASLVILIIVLFAVFII
ncbi:hypothetical protein COS77_02035 [Candidatus Roizmanbacteria bacterium CG06_land_8_20_14_3_00_34_14]|uniref:Uncharacterized protein n=2 Tax=Candidatus Roizmaniibacteriota TaxID=1752723 RepID=A0A2M7AUT1_9BACT|nr:MAG: hypothetical protein COT02_03575 [Candidatus Roizmanbacteria bacterium CG07_land_8_20_14_0_80_34_15]PIU74346.1 MAG: hypothetical protein COS77_02035 [Candidatus Roizmanbacteria bacterium CG06_land_8_20_14_3_00_34_14]